jgi:hypothetical protein
MCSNNSVTAIVSVEALSIIHLLMNNLRAGLSIDEFRNPLMQTFPSIGNIFNLYKKLNLQSFNRTFWIQFIESIIAKREEVTRQYAAFDQNESAIVDVESSENWLETGCFYFLDKVRNRPLYHPRESRTVSQASEIEGNCNKYYESFGSRGITNGAMVLHCNHGYFIGYHMFKTSEGLNDLFSALFTR